MTTKELLEKYYKGFAQKEEWDSVISDDFKICWWRYDKDSSHCREGCIY